jgi:hypothetical protein
MTANFCMESNIQQTPANPVPVMDVGSDGLLGWEGTAARLGESKACGLVRDGHTLTAVRLSDAYNAAQHLHAWRAEVLAVRRRNEELRNEVDGVLAENNRLRERIAKAQATLSA